MIFHCACSTRGVLDRALREHRRSSGSIPSSVLRARRAPGRSLLNLLRARIPGAQDQCECPSIPFIVCIPRAGGRLGYPSPPTPCTSTGDRLACPLLFPHVLNPMRQDFGVGSAINSRMASKTTGETRKGSGVFSRRNIIAILSTFTPEGRLDLSPTAHVQRGSLSNTICLLAEWSRLPFTCAHRTSKF